MRSSWWCGGKPSRTALGLALLLCARARAETSVTLVIDAARDPATGARLIGPNRDEVEFGSVNTVAGEPRTGRRIRTDGGAHFVVTLDATVDLRETVSRPSSPARIRAGTLADAVRRFDPVDRRVVRRDLGWRTLRATSLDALVTPRAVVYVQSATPSIGGCELRVASGVNTPWELGRAAGASAGAGLVRLGGPLSSGGTVRHQLSLFVPDSFSGTVHESLVYSVVLE